MATKKPKVDRAMELAMRAAIIVLSPRHKGLVGPTEAEIVAVAKPLLPMARKMVKASEVIVGMGIRPLKKKRS